MASRFEQFVKNKKYRPLLIIGLVLIGGLFLMMLLRPKGSSGGGTTLVETGPSEALQAANLQASVQMAQLNASLQGAAIEAQAAQNIAALDVEARLAEIAASAELGAAELQLTSELRDREIAASRDVQLAQIQSDVQRDLAREAANVASLEALGSIQTAAYDRDIALAGFDRDVQLAQTASTTELYSQAIAKSKRKHVPQLFGGAGGSSIGSQIAGVVGGIFSDLRLKRDIEQVGVADGSPQWHMYTIGDACEAGVMSNNVDPVYLMPMGEYSGVDYAALTMGKTKMDQA